MQKTETSTITEFILIAGMGELPVRLVRSAIQQGTKVRVFSLASDNFSKLSSLATTLRFSPVEVFRMLDEIKKSGIKNICFIGKVPKLEFFKNLHKLDTQLLKKIKELKDLNDDSLHFKILDFLEREHGLKVIKQNIFLQDLFPSEQVFTARQPTVSEFEEIVFGLNMAKGIAALDIGQVVVVQNKAVIAVEAIEGTSACIKRAMQKTNFLKQKSDLVVCKVSKPNQDERFDMPVIGVETIKILPKNSILAIEAHKTFFVDQERAIELADKKNICIMAKQLH
jgi:DUF1009 family protein